MENTNNLTAPKLKAAVTIVQAVGTAIKEAGAIPSGYLYSILNARGCTIQQYEQMINIFKQAGRVKEVGNLLYWID